jgi:hypothetical protein
MHTKPLLQDLKAEALNENCIKITIDSDLDLEGAMIKVLGPERLLMVSFKPTSYVNEICLFTGKPMFVELHTSGGTSVQYVKGSGKEFYNNFN